MMTVHVFFFFSSRRRHTRLQGDWSSDVCSSDLSRYFLRSAALFRQVRHDLRLAHWLGHLVFILLILSSAPTRSRPAPRFPPKITEKLAPLGTIAKAFRERKGKNLKKHWKNALLVIAHAK